MIISQCILQGHTLPSKPTIPETDRETHLLTITQGSVLNTSILHKRNSFYIHVSHSKMTPLWWKFVIEFFLQFSTLAKFRWCPNQLISSRNLSLIFPILGSWACRAGILLPNSLAWVVLFPKEECNWLLNW